MKNFRTIKGQHPHEVTKAQSQGLISISEKSLWTCGRNVTAGLRVFLNPSNLSESKRTWNQTKSLPPTCHRIWKLMSCTLHYTGKNKNIEISGTIIKTEVNQLKVLTQLDHEAHTKTSKNHLKTPNL